MSASLSQTEHAKKFMKGLNYKWVKFNREKNLKHFNFDLDP